MNCRFRTRVLMAAWACIALGGGLANAVPVVVNGDFETDAVGSQYKAITGWAQDPDPSGYSGFQYLSGTDDFGSPLHFWDNGNVPGAGTTGKVAFIETFVGGGGSVTTLALKQTVNGFEVGKDYILSYYENARAATGVNPTAETFVGGVSVVGAHLVTPVDLAGASTNSFHFQSVQFTATATSLEILFRSTQNNGNDPSLLLDNVSITAVPEPASLGLAGMAAIGLIAVRRRRCG